MATSCLKHLCCNDDLKSYIIHNSFNNNKIHNSIIFFFIYTSNELRKDMLFKF